MTTSVPRLAHLFAAALALIACSQPSKDTPLAAKKTTPPSSGDVAVRVDENGFSPSAVTATQGEPLTLVFTRTTDQTCAKAVAFPELKLETPLPKDMPVRVDVPTSNARTYTFQCGMGMFKSNIVIR
jgi:plastocyanin domain-containing protein